jgi:hypothetical protein
MVQARSPLGTPSTSSKLLFARATAHHFPVASTADRHVELHPCTGAGSTLGGTASASGDRMYSSQSIGPTTPSCAGLCAAE